VFGKKTAEGYKSGDKKTKRTRGLAYLGSDFDRKKRIRNATRGLSPGKPQKSGGENP